MKKGFLLIFCASSLCFSINQTALNMQQLYVLDQLQSLHVNYNNWTSDQWQKLQPIFDYVKYLGTISTLDPNYDKAQDELKKIYAIIEPVNKPIPVPGAFELLLNLANKIHVPAANETWQPEL